MLLTIFTSIVKKVRGPSKGHEFDNIGPCLQLFPTLLSVAAVIDVPLLAAVDSRIIRLFPRQNRLRKQNGVAPTWQRNTCGVFSSGESGYTRVTSL